MQVIVIVPITFACQEVWVEDDDDDDMMMTKMLVIRPLKMKEYLLEVNYYYWMLTTLL